MSILVKSPFQQSNAPDVSSKRSATTKVSIVPGGDVDGVYRFTLQNVNVAYANALRRTIITRIPINVIRTENEELNQCHVEINTTRFHNEILKQRLSCIPIHEKNLEILPGKYELDIDVSNDTDSIMYVTTEHFRIKNKETGNYCTKEETRRIFPEDPVTHCFVDFCRLRPKISDMIPGERIKLTADFSVATAKANSMFNVVSKCTYMNTMDQDAVAKEWERRQLELKNKYETITQEELEFEKRNFELLDAQRFFVNDSFDFSIQSVGIYDNEELLKKACVILQNKLVDMIQELISNSVPILRSEVTMDHCYDVKLIDEDYTVGRILEYVIYQRFYLKDKSVTYCGFKKMHPHNDESILRIAFATHTEQEQIRYVLKEACMESQEVLKQMHALF